MHEGAHAHRRMWARGVRVCGRADEHAGVWAGTKAHISHQRSEASLELVVSRWR